MTVFLKPPKMVEFGTYSVRGMLLIGQGVENLGLYQTRRSTGSTLK